MYKIINLLQFADFCPLAHFYSSCPWLLYSKDFTFYVALPNAFRSSIEITSTTSPQQSFLLFYQEIQSGPVGHALSLTHHYLLSFLNLFFFKCLGLFQDNSKLFASLRLNWWASSCLECHSTPYWTSVLHLSFSNHLPALLERNERLCFCSNGASVYQK